MKMAAAATVHTGLAITTYVVNGTYGGFLDFEVTVPIPKNHRIQWLLGETGDVTLVAQVSDEEPPHCNPQYGDRCDLSTNGTLRLDNLTYVDEGHYSLYVFDEDDFSADIVYYDLKVYSVLYPPSLSIVSDPIVHGTNVTLRCDAGNQNVTSYTFSRDETPMCSEPNVICNGPFLDFTPIHGDDSGSYTCTIENPVSSNTSDSVNVTVSVPVSGVTLTSNTSDLLLWPGRDSVSLNCSSNGTEVTYSWNLDGEPLPQDPQYQFTLNNSILIISPITTKDNGSFMCTATNWMNSENSTRLYLNLGSPVSEVTLTRNTSADLLAGQYLVSLYCTAQGSAINFTWNLNGNPLSQIPPYNITQSDSPPNSNLTFIPISRNNTGTYTCTATNVENNMTSNAINITFGRGIGSSYTAERSSSLLSIQNSIRTNTSSSLNRTVSERSSSSLPSIQNPIRTNTSNSLNRTVSERSSSLLPNTSNSLNGTLSERSSSSVLSIPNPISTNTSSSLNRTVSERSSSSLLSIQTPIGTNTSSSLNRTVSERSSSSLLPLQDSIGTNTSRSLNGTVSDPSSPVLSMQNPISTNTSNSVNETVSERSSSTLLSIQNPISTNTSSSLNGTVSERSSSLLPLQDSISTNTSSSLNGTVSERSSSLLPIQNPIGTNTSSSLNGTVSERSSSSVLSMQNPISTNTSNSLNGTVSERSSSLLPMQDSISTNTSSSLNGTVSDPSSSLLPIQNPIGTNTSRSLNGTVSDPSSPVLSMQNPISTNTSSSVNETVSERSSSSVMSIQNPTSTNTSSSLNGTVSERSSTLLPIQNPISTNTSNSLTVSVPVSGVTLTSNTSDLLLWPGKDSVSLNCSSNGTEVTYSWSLDGEPLPQDPQYQFTLNNSILIISPITTTDNGSFMCTATNWMNSENSTRLYLNLGSPVSAVTLISNTSGDLWTGQDSVSLYCSAQGSAITFFWSLNGNPVPLSPPYNITQSDSPPNSNLTISPLSGNYNGPFTCTATNLANNMTSNEVNIPFAYLRGMSDGAITGIVLGVLAFLIIIAVILLLLIRRRRRKNNKE